MRTSYLLATCIVLLHITDAYADNHVWIAQTTGEELFKYCRSPDSSPEKAFCIGFVSAAVSATSAIFGGNEQRIGCYFSVPDGVSVGRLVEIVDAGLAQNPSERKQSAIWLTTKYVRDVYPCN